MDYQTSNFPLWPNLELNGQLNLQIKFKLVTWRYRVGLETITKQKKLRLTSKVVS